MAQKISVKLDLGFDKFIERIVGEAMNIIVFTGLVVPFINFSTWTIEFDSSFFSNEKYLIMMLVIAIINYLWHRQEDKKK